MIHSDYLLLIDLSRASEKERGLEPYSNVGKAPFDKANQTPPLCYHD